MKNIFLIFIGGLAFLCLFLFFSKGCSEKKFKKELELKDKIIAECVNAPEKVDTVLVPTYLTDTVYLTYKYKVTDTVHESGAVDWQAQTIEQRFYSGIYTHPQFEIHWSADVTGTLDRLTFNPPSLIKNLIITKEKIIDLTKYQTEPIKERSHIYASIGTTFTFKEVQGVDLGLAYIHKRGFGVRAGIGTDFSVINYNAGLLFRLK